MIDDNDGLLQQQVGQRLLVERSVPEIEIRLNKIDYQMVKRDKLSNLKTFSFILPRFVVVRQPRLQWQLLGSEPLEAGCTPRQPANGERWRLPLVLNWRSRNRSGEPLEVLLDAKRILDPGLVLVP